VPHQHGDEFNVRDYGITMDIKRSIQGHLDLLRQKLGATRQQARMLVNTISGAAGFYLVLPYVCLKSSALIPNSQRRNVITFDAPAGVGIMCRRPIYIYLCGWGVYQCSQTPTFECGRRVINLRVRPVNITAKNFNTLAFNN